MRAELGRLAALAALAACGGTQRPPAPDQVEVLLYRDAATVRHRRWFDLRAGDNRVVFDGVPAAAGEDTARLAIVSGQAVQVRQGEHRTSERFPEDWVGREVAIDRSSGGRVGGRLRSVQGRDLVIAGAGGQLDVVSRPVEVRRSRTGGGERGLRWTVAAEHAGRRLLEAVYLVGGIAWQAGYTVVIDAEGRAGATLEGWLAIENHSDAPLGAARGIVIDRPAGRRLAAAAPPPPPPPPGDPREPAGVLAEFTPRPPPTAPAPAPQDPPPGRRVALRTPVVVPAGERVELPLVAGGAVRVPVTRTAVFDPVGFALDRAQARPVVEPGYGAAPAPGVAEPLATSVEVDLPAAGIDAEALPPGECLVFERDRAGELSLIGRELAFQRASAGGRLRLTIGAAQGLTGRRWQREATVDLEARRLVEEIRVEISSTRDTPAQVLVREHLYRGLNWALAYHNEVARLSKEGPQEIAFRLLVPARARRQIVYRVVYTW